MISPAGCGLSFAGRPALEKKDKIRYESCRFKVSESRSVKKKSSPTADQRPASRYLLRVNPDGRPVGIEEREKCHAGDGIWHSAFLVMIFDEAGRLMQAQRSRSKTLWPDYWDGTVASHFYLGEDRDMSVRKRISQEIGVTCGSLEYLFKFSYQSRYRDVGIEKEVCHVYRAGRVRTRDVSPDAAEVAQFRFSGLRELSQEVRKNAEVFTPWFLLAYRKYLQETG
jgi:isopentenyl-diphosphate delta-isomerase